VGFPPATVKIYRLVPFILPAQKPSKIAVRFAGIAAILTSCRGICRHNPTIGEALIVEPGAAPIVHGERCTSACEAEQWENFLAYLIN